MAIRNVLKMGDPRLSLNAQPVTDFDSEELLLNITDLLDTMRQFQGVGLAAPQIGVSKQIIVLEVSNNPRYPHADTIALHILLNPQITDFSPQTESAWEGCLSLPGLRGKVQRAKSIHYQAVNEKGERIQATVHGFHARIIQHEIDHLNGILYPQRLNNLNEFGFEDSLPDY